MEIALLVFVLIALIVMFFMNKRNQNNASSRELLVHLNSELRKEIQEVLKLTNGQEGEDFPPMMIEKPQKDET
jgi:preprotein translocase subunit YajC